MKLRRPSLAGIVRRGLQLGVFVFVVYAALGGLWRNYKVAHNNARLVELMEGPTWAWLYQANEDLLSLLGEPYRTSYDFLGMPWAATIFGVETADPIMVLAHVVSTGELSLRLAGSVAIAVVLAVVLGKVFCSHLCPMRLAFEFGQLIRAGLLRLRIPLQDYRSDTRLGGWVLVGGLVATVIASTTVWFLVLPYLNLAAGIAAVVATGTAGGLLTVALGWWLFDVLVAPGYFCHNLCPQGFLLEQLGRRSGLRVVKGPGSCPDKCRACTLACPYGLSPRDRTHRPACDNCGQCVPACPDRKLRRRFGLPIVTAALVGLVLLPAAASAHHNKGLPHYGYYENYPQVPTQEQIVVDGRWEMGATIFNFQGYERADSDTPNDVKFFVYLYDLQEDTNYTGAVDFDLVVDDEVVATFHRDAVDEELIYSTRETLPRSGDYQLIAHTRDPGVDARVALEFEIDLDEGGVSWGLIIALVAPLIPLFGLALLGRTRAGRARRMRMQLRTLADREAVEQAR